MIAAMIEGMTRICGKAQGYLGLPVRDEIIGDYNVMHTAWEPTPAELEALNKGAKVVISIIGNNPPPIQVNVNLPIEQENQRP